MLFDVSSAVSSVLEGAQSSMVSTSLVIGGTNRYASQLAAEKAKTGLYAEHQLRKRLASARRTGASDYRDAPRIEIYKLEDHTNPVDTFADFLLTGIAEQDSERVDIAETFGSPHLFTSNRHARKFTFNGKLRAARMREFGDASSQPRDLIPQHVLWKMFYDKYLRSTQQAVRGLITRLIVDGETYEGYVINGSTARSADNDMLVEFMFTMFVVKHSSVYESSAEEAFKALSAVQPKKKEAMPAPVIQAEIAAATATGTLVICEQLNSAGSGSPVKSLRAGSPIKAVPSKQLVSTQNLYLACQGPGSLTATVDDSGGIGVELNDGKIVKTVKATKEGVALSFVVTNVNALVDAAKGTSFTAKVTFTAGSSTAVVIVTGDVVATKTATITSVTVAGATKQVIQDRADVGLVTGASQTDSGGEVTLAFPVELTLNQALTGVAATDLAASLVLNVEGTNGAVVTESGPAQTILGQLKAATFTLESVAGTKITGSIVAHYTGARLDSTDNAFQASTAIRFDGPLKFTGTGIATLSVNLVFLLAIQRSATAKRPLVFTATWSDKQLATSITARLPGLESAAKNRALGGRIFVQVPRGVLLFSGHDDISNAKLSMHGFYLSPEAKLADIPVVVNADLAATKNVTGTDDKGNATYGTNKAFDGVQSVRCWANTTPNEQGATSAFVFAMGSSDQTIATPDKAATTVHTLMTKEQSGGKTGMYYDYTVAGTSNVARDWIMNYLTRNAKIYFIDSAGELY